MTFKVKFDTDNAAFEGHNLGGEIARILQVVARKVDTTLDGPTKCQTIHDINGNDVGRWSLTP